jgi:uncharacterized protein YaaN involved in tellurite resistance
MNDTVEMIGSDAAAATALNAAEIARANEIARRFDPRPSNAISQFGVAAQKRMGDLATPIVQRVRTKDMGPAGDALIALMARVRELKTDSIAGRTENLLAGLPLIGRAFCRMRNFLSRYERVAAKIDRLVDELKRARQALLADISQFDLLHAENAADFRDTLVFIRAGEVKLAELRQAHAAWAAKAVPEERPGTTQEARDVADQVMRLERRIHDLKLTAMIALQMAPQIRLVQSGDQALVEKIQNSILTTIPLWKNQVVMAIALFNQKKALELQVAVSMATKDLLAGNARLLQQGVTGIARESERGLVELSALQEVNNRLIATIQDTLQVQQEGRRKRQQAESQLLGLQMQLQDALVRARPPEGEPI